MAEEFKVLDEREHVLLRPNMYIGSTDVEPHAGIVEGEYQTLQIVPGLIKIINEILDNSIDEYIRTEGKYANRIDVEMKNKLFGAPNITIKDNGRGIPVETPEGSEAPRPVLAWSRARAGSNFTADERTTIGMNGVGAFCTMVFSKAFTGITNDGKSTLYFTAFENGERVKYETASKDKQPRGTMVNFEPDLTRLGDLSDITDDHVTFMRDRLMNLSVCFPGISFRLNGETIKFRTVKAFAKQFAEKPITENSDQMLMVLANAGDDEEFRSLSYVNGLNISNGGTHVDYIIDGLISELRPMIKRRHKVDITPNNIKQHLLLVSIIRDFPNPKFDSQTKQRVTNSKKEIEGVLGGLIDFKRLAKKVIDNDDIIEPIVRAAIIKKEQAERAALARKQKKLKRTNIPKHIEAQSKDPEKRTLFIAEGDSAMNPLLNVRDPYTVGGYPLRGKPKNTWGMKPAEIAKNKELSELIAILGLEYNQPARNPNYGRIVALTDADTDGSSIMCLLLCFLTHWRDLFDDGRVYRALSPRYVATKKGDVRWFYTDAELRKAKLGKGWEIDYIKGLGSLPTEIYHEIINQPRLERIMFNDADREMLEMAFGDDSEKRKDWLAA